jgi:signal transduction histidine kinase/CheY-like chemotaxis protein
VHAMNTENFAMPSPITTEASALFIESQYIDLYNKQCQRTHHGLAFCILVLYFILNFRINSYYPLIWLFIALLVNITRLIPVNVKDWHHVRPVNLIAYSYIMRALVFIVALFGFQYLNDIDRAIYTIIFLTLCTASVSTTNGYKNKYLWYIFPMMISLSAAWMAVAFQAADKQWEYSVVSLLILAYLAYLVGLGKDLFAVFEASCNIRFSENAKNEQLKLALEESKIASMAKTRFLASASHDLRQPMHTMGVLLAALGMRSLDTRSREIVDVLGTVNSSLASQLDGLLDISKLDAGVVQPNLQVYRLDELVKAHVAKISLTDKKENLYVRVHAPQEILVRTDNVLFERVLMNLTTNAIKFTESGGVDISISMTDQKAILEVADTGIGIAHEMHQLVFQEFYQVGNPERDRAAGLGLGLSIVKRICALLNIHVHLISKPNQGCRFVLTLPLVKNVVHTPTQKATLGSVHLPAMTVLVIDDEVDVRTGMRLLLEELGCTVVLADGIDQAVTAAKSHKFDIVFSDYRLRGDENGIDAIGQVRLLLPKVDAVLITGDTAPERLQSANKAGIQMLHKPVSFEDIVKQLQRSARIELKA